MSEQLGITQIGEFNYRNVLWGDYPRSKEWVTLPAGSIWVYGSVLAKAADGTISLIDSATDTPATTTEATGSVKPWGVLMEDVDTTGGPAVGIVYQSGEFIGPRLIFGGTDTWETWKEAARLANMYFKDAALQPNQ